MKLFKVLVYLLVVFWEGKELIIVIKEYYETIPAVMQYKSKKEGPVMKEDQTINQITVETESKPTLIKEPLVRPASH